MSFRIALCVLVAVPLYLAWAHRSVWQPDGVRASDVPQQEGLTTQTPFLYKGYTVTPVARFTVRARVLGTERYYFDAFADLAPVDLALGWGPMSDNAVLKDVSISQSKRFYWWSASSNLMPRDSITHHSANMHFIPSTEALDRQLKAVRTGHIVRFTGELVNAIGPDGRRMVSSTTRTDTGAGACEVVWLTALTIE